MLKVNLVRFCECIQQGCGVRDKISGSDSATLAYGRYCCGATKCLAQCFLTGGGGVKWFPGGREPFHALQHGKFWNGNVSLQMLRQCQFYVATCYLVVLAEVEVGVQVSWNFAGRIRACMQTFSGKTRRLFSRHAKHDCGVGGKISDSGLSKISDSWLWLLNMKEWNLAVKINGNRGAQQEICFNRSLKRFPI